METISNIATAASKAIWGEDKASHVEPVSGKLGNVAAGEPYDAGNMGSKPRGNNPRPAQPCYSPASQSEPRPDIFVLPTQRGRH